jgi:hypothetical protein
MDSESQTNGDTLESIFPDAQLNSSELLRQLSQIALTAKTPQEAKAQITVYEKISELQIGLIKTQHELEIERQNTIFRMEYEKRSIEHQWEIEGQEQSHLQRMEILKFVVPIISGLGFAAVGLTLISNSNITIQYIGVALLFIGACALIPGISKVLVNITEAIRNLHGMSQEFRKAATEAAKKERRS